MIPMVQERNFSSKSSWPALVQIIPYNANRRGDDAIYQEKTLPGDGLSLWVPGSRVSVPV